MIVAGIGCRKGVSAAADRRRARHGAGAGRASTGQDRPAGDGSKQERRGWDRSCGRGAGLRLIFVAQADLETAGARGATWSARVLALAGVPSVAEAAALAACGPKARLILPRIVVGPVTCALAESGEARMTVHFIGAGPGAADLITVRGRDLIARCPVCLYAGSIVPQELLAYCPPGARIVDTAPLSLDEIEAEFVAAHEAGQDVARLQSGDLSI